MKYPFGLAAILLAASVNAAPVGSAFTYQGQLSKEGTPVSALQDFQFGLYDAATAGAQIGTTLTLQAVTVEKGLFTVPLDFGSAAFGADARFLQIVVKPTGQATFATLAPRVSITPAPVALTALSALTAKTALTANAVTTGSVGPAALQNGSVGWSHLSPDLFPVSTAVMTADHALGAAGPVNFDSTPLASNAITRSTGGFQVSQAGLYKIDLSLTMNLVRTDKVDYDVNVNGLRRYRFTDFALGLAPIYTRYTVSDYLTLNQGDTVTISASSNSESSIILGSSTSRYSYLSIARVK